MNVKIVGSWKNDEQRECYWQFEKSWKLILEARKSSEKAKACEKILWRRKKIRKKKKKQAEKASSP